MARLRPILPLYPPQPQPQPQPQPYYPQPQPQPPPQTQPYYPPQPPPGQPQPYYQPTRRSSCCVGVASQSRGSPSCVDRRGLPLFCLEPSDVSALSPVRSFSLHLGALARRLSVQATFRAADPGRPSGSGDDTTALAKKASQPRCRPKKRHLRPLASWGRCSHRRADRDAGTDPSLGSHVSGGGSIQIDKPLYKPGETVWAGPGSGGALRLPIPAAPAGSRQACS